MGDSVSESIGRILCAVGALKEIGPLGSRDGYHTLLDEPV
jgi:hypothetical protein